MNEVWVADQDEEKISAWGHFTGTHQDVVVGVPATGKTVKIGFMDIWLFEDGLLAENWVHVDTTGFMQQVGAAPVPETLADAAV